jgi:hypothetical protein
VAGDRALFRPLVLTLTPLGGAGLFLGLSATTVKLLRYEGLGLAWVQSARAVLLMAAVGWCLWLGWRQLRGVGRWSRCLAGLCVLLSTGLVGGGGWLQFWGWG